MAQLLQQEKLNSLPYQLEKLLGLMGEKPQGCQEPHNSPL